MNDDFLTPADQSYPNYVQNAETCQKGSSYQRDLKGQKSSKRAQNGTVEPKGAQKGSEMSNRDEQWFPDPPINVM